MDKDILMIGALRKIIQILNRFSAGPKIKPAIKKKLDVKRIELGALVVKFTTLLLEDSDLINDEELAFAEQIQEVMLFGIDNDQQLVLDATDQLITYITEKMALIQLVMHSEDVDTDTDAPADAG